MPEPVATIAGVVLTHPDKVFFPKAGVTKLDLARYYEKVAAQILPHIQNRPVSLVRAPHGTEDYTFYQKHPGESFPAFIERVKIKEKEGSGIYIVLDALNDLIYLVNLGVLEFHIWGSQADNLEQPDRLVFDLDPGEGAGWDLVARGAEQLRQRLTELNLQSFLMTSGSKGLHVVVPIRPEHSWSEAKEFTKSLAQTLVTAEPDKFTLELPKEKRVGKVFVDFLRNQRGATAIAPFSTRARDTASIAAPIPWNLSREVRANSYSLETVSEVIELNAWAEYCAVSDQRLKL